MPSVLRLTSTSGVHVPPRGRSFMKFSFDFPEPSVETEGLSLGFLVFTYENAYGLDPSAMKVTEESDGLRVDCDRFLWAGGQESTRARFEAHLRTTGDTLEWDATVEMERPIKAVTSVLRGVPRGRISSSGQSFFDPGEDEVLLGYPFSGGDLFGPGSARGMTTPLAIIETSAGRSFLPLLSRRPRPHQALLLPARRGLLPGRSGP